MGTVGQLITDKLSGLTSSGIRRLSYTPYEMAVALIVVKRIGRSIDPHFELTPDVKEIYIKLIQYFHGDPAFPGDLTKGIMLMGPTGNGKTVAMSVMAIYREIDDIRFMLNNKTVRLIYEVVDVSHIVNSFITKFYEGIQTYTSRYVLCMDDIGSEIDFAKHYGNKIDVISFILSERYSNKLLTFATSNYPLQTLEEKYDDRIVSRMYALFNFIPMKGEDFRKAHKKA